MATWQQHACCRLNIVKWRLHHAFNIWMGAHYICAHIRQIIGCMHVQILLSFWINFIKDTYTINSIYTMNLRMLSLCVLIDPWLHYPTEKLLVCIISHALLYGWLQRMDFLLAIESPLISSSLSIQLVGR